AVPDQTEDAGGFSSRKDISEIAVRGPLTPDHVLRTKNIPVMLDENPVEAIETFKNQYLDYFKRNTDGKLTCLDPAPRWAVW
ncbi:MAG: bifunctional aldolase/short-chain dehydrogenase, partial [bacterium]